jgi:hypothetical protein
MSPGIEEEAAVKEIYLLLRLAAARRRPVVYDGLPRLLCPHVLGRKSGRLRVLCYQFGGNNNSGMAVASETMGGWRCLTVEKLSLVELTHGTPSHAHRGKPASMKLISMPTLSPETTRNRGNEAIAVVTNAPE